MFLFRCCQLALCAEGRRGWGGDPFIDERLTITTARCLPLVRGVLAKRRGRKEGDGEESDEHGDRGRPKALQRMNVQKSDGKERRARSSFPNKESAWRVILHLYTYFVSYLAHLLPCPLNCAKPSDLDRGSMRPA